MAVRSGNAKLKSVVIRKSVAMTVETAPVAGASAPVTGDNRTSATDTEKRSRQARGHGAHTDAMKVCGQGRTGHRSFWRASLQAIFVDAIFASKSSSNALTIPAGGPASMVLRSGRPWLSILLKLRGRLRDT